jgi:hypothetical protein
VRWWRRERAFEEAARRRAQGAPLHRLLASLERCGFNAGNYVRANPDLQQLGDLNTATMHLIAGGLAEGRQFPIDLDLDGLNELVELNLPPDFKVVAAATLVNNGIAPAARVWIRGANEQRSFWARLMPILKRMASPYLIIGDSHSGLYRHVISSPRPLVPVHLLISACSAVGLGNRDSRSGAARRLAPLAEAIGSVPAIFKFGQVDVEFVHAFKRIDAGQARFDPEEFDGFCRRSVGSYVGFLDDHFSHAAVTLASIFPPTLSDEAWRQGYVNAHIADTESDRPLEELRASMKQLQVPTLFERTRHHAYYNEILRDHAGRSGFAFVDDFSPFIGADGVVDSRFLPTTGGRDHHLEKSPTATILRNIISRTVIAADIRPI